MTPTPAADPGVFPGLVRARHWEDETGRWFEIQAVSRSAALSAASEYGRYWLRGGYGIQLGEGVLREQNGGVVLVAPLLDEACPQ